MCTTGTLSPLCVRVWAGPAWLADLLVLINLCQMCISVFVYSSLTVWDAMVGNNIMNRDCQTRVCLWSNGEPFTALKEVMGSPVICIFQHTSGYSTQEFRLHGPWGLPCVSSAFLTISWLERGWRPTQGCCSGEQSQSLGRRGGGLHTKTLFLPL